MLACWHSGFTVRQYTDEARPRCGEAVVLSKHRDIGCFAARVYFDGEQVRYPDVKDTVGDIRLQLQVIKHRPEKQR